jgi:hypothetical protein
MFKIIILVITLLISLIVIADTSTEIYTLAKEKSQLIQEGLQLLKKYQIHPENNPNYETASKAALTASQNFIKQRKNHPDLKNLEKESQKELSAIITATRNNDKIGKKEAMKQYTKTQKAIQQKVTTIPELVIAQKKAITANNKMKKAKLTLISTLPEGPDYLNKIKILENKIIQLQNQL